MYRHEISRHVDGVWGSVLGFVATVHSSNLNDLRTCTLCSAQLLDAAVANLLILQLIFEAILFSRSVRSTESRAIGRVCIDAMVFPIRWAAR